MLFLSCLTLKYSYCQNQNNYNKSVKAFIGVQSKTKISKTDFMAEEIISITSDTFKLASCTVYFSYCGDEKDNTEHVTTLTLAGNSLKDPYFIKLLNERHFPVCITLDNILIQNKPCLYFY